MLYVSSNLIFILVLLISARSLKACDMMSLISFSEQTLSELCEIQADDNDPSDFFQFLKDRSNSYTNNDGYGIVYYKNGDQILTEEQKWFKTGFNCWYGDGDDEPMDEAIGVIMEPSNTAVIVMGHDRNANLGYGSHPLVLEWNNRSFSFMHNGSLDLEIKDAIMNYLGEDWFLQYPSNWEGEFSDPDSFIDSELLFHFIMNRIIDFKGSVILGIYDALNDTDVLGYNLKEEFSNCYSTINFVLSDGEKLYVFRNSPLSTVRNLCYEIFDTGFIGIKTIDTLENLILPNSLVVFSRDFDPLHFDFYFADFTAQPVSGSSPLKVDFKDFSGENVISWEWDFQNDGIIDSWEKDPTFIYENPGVYDVKLIVNKAMFSDYILKTALINVFDDYGDQKILLQQNYPNPFKGSTSIGFQVTRNCKGCLSIYDIKGKAIIELLGDHTLTAGEMIFINWDGRDHLGHKLSSGIYFYELRVENTSVCRKMILNK